MLALEVWSGLGRGQVGSDSRVLKLNYRTLARTTWYKTYHVAFDVGRNHAHKSDPYKTTHYGLSVEGYGWVGSIGP